MWVLESSCTATRKGWLPLLSVAILWNSARGGAIAEGGAPAPNALTLLDIGWKPSDTSFAEAYECYERLRAASPRDVRAAYSMTLVAIRHQRAGDAAQFIDAALAMKPTNLHLRGTRLWILAWNRDFKAVLSEMPSLATDLAANRNTMPDQQLQQQARRLGEIVAFLRGPGGLGNSGEEVAVVEQSIGKSLPAEAQESFSAGQAAVQQIERQIADELHAAQLKAKADKEAKISADLAKYQQVRETCAKLTAQILPPYEKGSRELYAERESLRSTNRIVETADPKGGTRTEGTNDRAIDRVNLAIINVREAAAAAVAKVRQQDYHAASRIAHLEKEAKRVESGLADDAHSMALQKQLTALRTYCEFPLDAERDKLVASFRNK